LHLAQMSRRTTIVDYLNNGKSANQLFKFFD
jgi:hypothetical protein